MQEGFFYVVFRVFGILNIAVILFDLEKNHSNKSKPRYFFMLLVLCLPLFLFNLIAYEEFAHDKADNLVVRGAQILYYVCFVVTAAFGFLYNYKYTQASLSIKNRKLRKVAEYALIVLPTAIFMFFCLIDKTQTLCLSAILLYINYLYNDNQNELISLDPLTRLNNRNEFTGYLRHKLSSPMRGKICLLMMDMNKFKSINDTYGHVEGDKALIRVADCLKKACSGAPGRPFIARYGGDEFIIVMETESDIEVTHIIDCINMMMAVENHRLKTPYNLSISIGWVRNEQNNKSFRKLLDRADKQLYIKKSALKEKERTA